MYFLIQSTCRLPELPGAERSSTDDYRPFIRSFSELQSHLSLFTNCLSRYRFRPSPTTLDWVRCRSRGRRKPAELHLPRTSASSAPNCGPTSSCPPVDCRPPVPNPQSRRSPPRPATTDCRTQPPHPPCHAHRPRHALHTSSASYPCSLLASPR